MRPRARHRLFAVVVLLACGPGAVRAQDQGPTPRSPAVATLLSLGGTVAPMAFAGGRGLVGGLILGPNLGDFYGRNAGYGVRRTAVRAAVAAATLGLAGAICADGGCGILGEDDSNAGAAAVVLVMGSVITGAIAFQDIWGVDDRTAERNALLERRVRVGPTLDPATGGLGVVVDVRF